MLMAAKAMNGAMKHIKPFFLSGETQIAASLGLCNFKDYNKYQAGFAPTVSGLDLHLPGDNNLPRLPNLSLIPGNVPGGLNLMQRNKYSGIFDPSPNGNFGYPHLTYPNNHYDYTPHDAIWANTTNNTNYDDNTMHVEDPNPEIANFLVEEIAPHNLYLSNRTLQGISYSCSGNDGILTEKYYADFEARNSILAGDQSIYQHEPNPNTYQFQRTAPGDFVVSSSAVVTLRANNADGNSKVTLGAGFSTKHGSIFRAYVHGDAYCQTTLCGAAGRAEKATPKVSTQPSRPIVTKRLNSQKLTTFNKKVAVFLYPNPTQGSIIYNITDEEAYEYIITDITGKTLSGGKINNSVNQIDLSLFEKGLYLITISNKNYKQTDRVILQ
jgi:hypothetical protein